LSRGSQGKSSSHIDAEFIGNWRNVKLLELNAIANGDQELGVMAANRSRELWRNVSQFQLDDDVALARRLP
jgi:hypothetical protein